MEKHFCTVPSFSTVWTTPNRRRTARTCLMWVCARLSCVTRPAAENQRPSSRGFGKATTPKSMGVDRGIAGDAPVFKLADGALAASSGQRPKVHPTERQDGFVCIQRAEWIVSMSCRISALLRRNSCGNYASGKKNRRFRSSKLPGVVTPEQLMRHFVCKSRTGVRAMRGEARAGRAKGGQFVSIGQSSFSGSRASTPTWVLVGVLPDIIHLTRKQACRLRKRTLTVSPTARHARTPASLVPRSLMSIVQTCSEKALPSRSVPEIRTGKMPFRRC